MGYSLALGADSIRGVPGVFHGGNMPRLKLGERDGKVSLLIGLTHGELKALKQQKRGELPVPEGLFTFTDSWGSHDIKELYFVSEKDDDALLSTFKSIVLKHEKTQREGGDEEKEEDKGGLLDAGEEDIGAPQG
jgi:hypothetical protein